MDFYNEKKKYIAVLIQNFVQFYAIKPFVDLYDKAEIHLYVPQCDAEEEYVEMYENIYVFLSKNYKNVYRKTQHHVYDILMEPYPIHFFDDLKYKNRVKYKYSVNSAKPEPVYRPEHNYKYDVILCHNSYEKEIFSAYAQTELVEKINYANFHKNAISHSKKRILYAPTFGDLCSINDTLLNNLIKLSSEYEIITKMHHATTSWRTEAPSRQTIKQTFSNCYDETAPLSDILSNVDAVITDNSGTIFEAMYAGIPVATFSKADSGRAYNGIRPLQDMLRHEGIIPYTNNPNELSSLIKKVLNKNTAKKQNEYSNQLFQLENRYSTKKFFKTIDTILEEPELARKNRKILKHALSDYITDLNQEIADLQSNIQTLETRNAELKIVAEARISTKIMNKIRSICSRKGKK